MNEDGSVLLSELSNKLEIDLPEKRSLEELKVFLSGYIDHLISNNPDKLVSILSRVDVSERELKANLQKKEENASSIMAQMIIERQIEKIKTRERFRSNDDISEDEKW
jgi:cupin superfamily acireductone dioxygenase involved in methionine salvage